MENNYLKNPSLTGTVEFNFRKIYHRLKSIPAQNEYVSAAIKKAELDSLYQIARSTSNKEIEITIADTSFLKLCLKNAFHPSETVGFLPDLEHMQAHKQLYKTDIQPGEQMLFMFNIYDPFVCKLTPNYCLRMKLTATVALLSSQTLDKLCDMVPCKERFQEVRNELTNNSNSEIGIKMRETYKSQMLYFGNNFYIDTSFDGFEDYSTPIKEWGAGSDSSKKFGETYSMNNTTVLDLIARAKYPYVLQHLGGCEHFITIEQVRLLTSNDCLQRHLYPFYLFKSKDTTASRMCMICNRNLAMWMVFNETRLPLNPSDLCKSCFLEFQYTDGKKMSNFQAVRFLSS